jgi:hypothetical protein
MIRVAITEEAFEAIKRTLPFGSVAVEAKVDAKGKPLIWLEPQVVNKLRTMRGPGESYSDVVLRPAERSRSDPERAFEAIGGGTGSSRTANGGSVSSRRSSPARADITVQ